jgi:hypothetical protein
LSIICEGSVLMNGMVWSYPCFGARGTILESIHPLPYCPMA